MNDARNNLETAGTVMELSALQWQELANRNADDRDTFIEIAERLTDERNDLRNQLDAANDLVSDLRTELEVQVNSNLLTIHENARASWVAADKANAWETRYLHQCDVTARALKSRQEWIDYGLGMKSFVIPNLSIMFTLIFLWLAFGLGFVEPIVNGKAWLAGVMEWITWF